MTRNSIESIEYGQNEEDNVDPDDSDGDGERHGDGEDGEVRGAASEHDPEEVLLLRAIRQAADLSVHRQGDKHLPQAQTNVLHQGEGPGGETKNMLSHVGRLIMLL